MARAHSPTPTSNLILPKTQDMYPIPDDFEVAVGRMVWTGLHGLIGTGVALATRGRMILGDAETRTMRFGIVWGSIVPDVDLLISIVIIAAGGNMQQALAPHRTLNHSFTILALALIGLTFWRTGWSRRVGGGLFGIAVGSSYTSCLISHTRPASRFSGL